MKIRNIHLCVGLLNYPRKGSGPRRYELRMDLRLKQVERVQFCTFSPPKFSVVPPKIPLRFDLIITDQTGTETQPPPWLRSPPHRRNGNGERKLSAHKNNRM